jgi:NAD+ synthase
MFDVEKTVEALKRWIIEWFDKNGPGCNAIVGISGGKDSSIVAALCAAALGCDRVIGVLIPNGKQSDIDMSYKLVSHLGIRHYVINIKAACDGVMRELEAALPQITSATVINLPARIRMSVLYAVAQSCNGRVANTCNLSENWVGYSTHYGDSVGDFSPLAQFTVDEVKQIGHALGLPPEFTEKVPGDGLSGKTDEYNLGFTYAALDKYIRTGVCDDPDVKRRIDEKHRQNRFKLEPMQYFDSGLPIYADD